MRGLCCLKFCILPSIVIVLAAAGISLFLSPMRAAAITQDRARRTHRGVQSQPAPASTSTLGPSTRSTPLPSPTPTQVPSPRDRIAPQLGEPPPPPVLKAKPSPTPEGGEEIDPESVVRVNTELVTLNVRVIDRNNKPIGDVTESDLRVFEDGEPQPIEFFSKEEVPVTYGLAIDTSGSLRSQLQTVIDAARAIIDSNKLGDETFIERFISSDKIEILQDFTTSKELLGDGLDNLYVEGGQTAVIDGVYLAADHVSNYKKGDENDRRRRALIVITDGEDRNSYYKQDQLFVKLREEDVQIYVIGFVKELEREGGFIRKSPREKAVNLLNKLATETGGRAFFPVSLSALPQIANEIVRDLRTQYILAYNPTNKNRDGSYRAIRVAVSDVPERDKRIALTRSGRLAPKGEPPTSKPLPQKTPAKSSQPASKSR
jgi:Ca-activated chloride channel homolog